MVTQKHPHQESGGDFERDCNRPIDKTKVFVLDFPRFPTGLLHVRGNATPLRSLVLNIKPTNFSLSFPMRARTHVELFLPKCLQRTRDIVVKQLTPVLE